MSWPHRCSARRLAAFGFSVAGAFHKREELMNKINCQWAKFVAWNGSEPLYECRSERSRSRLSAVKDSICAKCATRAPIDRKRPPIIEEKREDRQISIKEYMDATT